MALSNRTNCGKISLAHFFYGGGGGEGEGRGRRDSGGGGGCDIYILVSFGHRLGLRVRMVGGQSGLVACCDG